MPSLIFDIKPEIVEKQWGNEQILVNEEDYRDGFCGKILTFEKGKNCSLHFHKQKFEFFCILSGKFQIQYVSTETGEELSRIVGPFEIIEIPPCVPHQMFALEAGQILEISSFDRREDSYRIRRGLV